MKARIIPLIFLSLQALFAQSDLVCPTDKLKQEGTGPATFCDSLRIRQNSDWIFAYLRIKNEVDSSSGDTSMAAALKRRCLYIISKYEIYLIGQHTRIQPTDTTYLSVDGMVFITKGTALNLVQDDYVELVELASGPRTPETPPYWPSSIRAPNGIATKSYEIKGKKINIKGQSVQVKNSWLAVPFFNPD